MSSTKHVLNFILTFAFGIIFLFLGVAIAFFLIDSIPGDVVVQILPPGPFNQTEYNLIVELYGFNDPLYIRFLRYLTEMFSGRWEYAFAVDRSTLVAEMIGVSFPRTVEFLILPLFAGFSLAYLLGRISNRTKRRLLKGGIQLLSVIGIAVLVFFFGMCLQFSIGYIIPLFPTTGYKTYSYPTPNFTTGFMILDALISGENHLALDILYHYALPWMVTTFAITVLMTKVFSSRMGDGSKKERTILTNTGTTSLIFGAIFLYVILIDTTFGLHGFGERFLIALRYGDYFLLRGCTFVITLSFVATLIISNLIFSLIRVLKDKKGAYVEIEKSDERQPKISIREQLKEYVNRIVRSPLTIIGLVAILIPITLSLFTEWITGTTLNEALGVYPGAWDPPSPENPLGKTEFGRDVLALMLYGIGNALLFGIGAVFIALIGGLVLGIPAKLHRIVRALIMAFTLIFYVLSGILLFMLFARIIAPGPGVILIATGLLLIPSFTRVVANSEFRIVSIGKRVLAYIPLFIGISISIHVSLGFLGVTNPLIVQLGILISDARVHLYDAPWASFWPGFATFIIVASFFILHEGLKKHSR